MIIVKPFEQWQLILCGPMLRRVTPTSVCVFVALSQPASVTLQVYQGNSVGMGDLEVSWATLHTIPLGRYLHVLAIEAHLPDGEKMLPGQIYSYDLAITPDGTSEMKRLRDLGLLQNPLPLGYEENRLPSFALPPGLDQLRMVHGSCRKAGGEGLDALVILDGLIHNSFTSPLERPHQLLLTGDQIYADDVPACLLLTLNKTASQFLGWSQPEAIPWDGGDLLPSDPRLTPGHARKEFTKWHKPVNYTTPATRQRFADFRTRLEFMYTQTDFSSVESDAHLLFLSEYYAQYLFAWSPELWPRDNSGKPDLTDAEAFADLWKFPSPYSGPDIVSYTNDQSDYMDTARKVRERALQFASGMAQVRRALANVPTYMIFDDHDVTDDWNIFSIWNENVLSNPAGQQVVRNALLAYAIFQDWGNDPAKYDSGVGLQLLAGVTWDKDHDKPMVFRDPDTRNAVNAILRLEAASAPGLPDFSKVLRWDYVIQGPSHQVLMLDTRTWRSFPPGQKTPAALISSDMLPLQFQGLVDGLQTFIVSSGPAFGHGLVDSAQEVASTLSKEEADYERWSLNDQAFNQLMDQIAQREKVIYLCGDVHYAFTKRIDFRLNQYNSSGIMLQTIKKNRMVQFCCSSLHNETRETRLLEATFPVNVSLGYFFQPDQATLQEDLNARLEAYFKAAVDHAPILGADPDYYYRLNETLFDIHEKRRLGLPVAFPQGVGPAYDRVESAMQETHILWKYEAYGVESPLNTLKIYSNLLESPLQNIPLPGIISSFVVGHDNIGLITFTNSAGNDQVVQTLYWNQRIPILGDRIWSLSSSIPLTIP